MINVSDPCGANTISDVKLDTAVDYLGMLMCTAGLRGERATAAQRGETDSNCEGDKG